MQHTGRYAPRHNEIINSHVYKQKLLLKPAMVCLIGIGFFKDAVSVVQHVSFLPIKIVKHHIPIIESTLPMYSTNCNKVTPLLVVLYFYIFRNPTNLENSRS